MLDPATICDVDISIVSGGFQTFKGHRIGPLAICYIKEDSTYCVVHLRTHYVCTETNSFELAAFVADNLAPALEAFDDSQTLQPALADLDAWFNTRTTWFKAVCAAHERDLPMPSLRHWERETRTEACDE